MLPRKPDERISQAKEMYLKGMKLVEIASQLKLPEGTVRRWKSTHKWDSERSDKNSERSDKNNERSDKKKGGQPDNKNAVGHGAPTGNQNAKQHGLSSLYLPEDTRELFFSLDSADPLHLLRDQIKLAYTAIVRAQPIMYVR